MELCAFLAVLLLLQGLKIEVVGIRERVLTRNHTRRAVISFPSLVRRWREENFTLGTHSIVLTSSWIWISYTSTRQWSNCYLTLHNKRQTTAGNEANCSTSEISRRVESRLLNCWNEKRGIHWLYHSEDVLASTWKGKFYFLRRFSVDRVSSTESPNYRSRCLYYSNSCAAR